MRKLNGRELKAFLILSVVVPISLLVTFRITGILPEPSIPEIFTAEAVTWNFERPGLPCRVNETVENSYSDEHVSIVFSIHLENYVADVGQPFGTTADATNMLVSIRANVSEGFVENLDTVFRTDYEPAYVNIWSESYSAYYETLNVSVKKRVDYITNSWELENDTKGFISTAGINQPSGVSFGFPAHWIIKDEGNKTTEITVVGELTYRTENSYEKVILPIQLRLFNDDDDDFSVAFLPDPGAFYSRLWIGGYDVSDFYKIRADKGNVIKVNATSASFANYDWSPSPFFEVHIYNPLKNKEAATEPSYSHFLTYPVDFTGEWFFEIRIIKVGGFYSLTIDVEAD